MIYRFLAKPENNVQGMSFRKKYKKYIEQENGYVGLLFLIQNFRHFNLFDHLQYSSNNESLINKNYYRRIYISSRNTVFLRLLITAAKYSSSFFPDLQFLDPHVDYFKSLLLTDLCSNVEYDIEFFFMAYFNYSEQAKEIAMKYLEFFKAYFSFYNITFTVDSLVNDIFLKHSYTELTLNEIMIYRKILNNIIKRNLFFVIDYFFDNVFFLLLASEGRIWSSIIKTFSNEEIMLLWLKYEKYIDEIKKAQMKLTIDNEYTKKLIEIIEKMKEENNPDMNENVALQTMEEREVMKRSYKSAIQKMEMEMELDMGFVVSLADLIRIMITIDQKTVAFYFLQTLKEKDFTKEMQREIFNYLIEQDEETSLFFLVKIASYDIVEPKHMKTCLMNKFFQLALELIRCDICKVVLNSSPPDSEFYISYFHKSNYKQKMERYKRLTLKTMTSLDDGSGKEISKVQLNRFKTTQLFPYFLMQSKLAQLGEEHHSQLQLQPQPQPPVQPPYQPPLHQTNETNQNDTNTNLLNNNSILSKHSKGLKQLNQTAIKNKKTVQVSGKDIYGSKRTSLINNAKDKMKDIKESNSTKTKQMNFDINVQMILIDQLRFGEHSFYCLCLLCSINEGNLIIEYADKICKSLMVLAKENDEIIKCKCPILLCVLAAEFILKIGRLNRKMHFKCQTVADHLIQLAQSFHSVMKEENMLKYFLTEQVDNQMRNALEIIAENRFVSLLNTNIDPIIKKQTYNKGEKIMTFFRIPRLIMVNKKDQSLDEILKLDYFPPNASFNFQFHQFIIDFDLKNSMFIFNSIVVSSIFIFYLTWMTNKKYDSIAYFSYFFAFMIFLQYLMRFVYIGKTGKKLFLSSFDYINDLIGIIGIILCEFHFKYRLDNNDEFEDYMFYIGFSLIVLSSLSEVFVFLQNTSIGNIIRVIVDLREQLIGFICIYFCLTACCAQLFVLFFRNSNPDFSDLFKGLTTLYNASFGIYNYDNFHDLSLFGSILLMIYIAITNIALLNLFIAIINNLFQKYTHNNLAEIRAVEISVNKKLKWDKEYGSLILLPPPFSIFTSLLSFLFLCTNDRKKEYINLLIAKISYFQIALCIFVFNFIFSLVIIPIAMIKGSALKFVDTFITNEDFVFRNSTIQYICFCIFFPFLLIKYLIEDSRAYWRLVYAGNIMQNTTDAKIPITKDNIQTLREILLQLKCKDLKKIASLNDVYEKYFELHMPKIPTLNYQSDGNVLAAPLSLTSKPTKFPDLFGKQKMPNDMRYLIDKITDEDQQINIDLALGLIVQREIYHNRFLEYLYYFNIRLIKRALQKFAFANEAYSSTYSFKKMQNLIYKLTIKFRMMYVLFTDKMINQVRPKIEYINQNQDYFKKVALKEKKGHNYSDYDEEEEIEGNDIGAFIEMNGMLSPLI